MLSQARHWDQVTAEVVTARTGPPAALRFFTAPETACARALLNLLTGQDEPEGELAVPVLEMVDARLEAGETDGWRYEDMPEDGQAWRETLSYLDADAGRRCGTSFADGPEADQAALVQAVQDLNSADWHGLPGRARVEPVDPVRLHGHVRAPVRLVRDRFPRARLPARLQERRRRQARAVRGPRRAARRGPYQGGAVMGPRGGVRARNESAWLLPNDGTRTNHRLRLDMRQFADSDEIDLVIVGCGAGGSVLAQRLARAGWRVAALDAGPFWDPDTDWVSDEAGSHHLYWTDPRVIAGADPVPMGSNNSGRGVGGSMVHSPATPRASTRATS